jgi:hypothetical protein
VSREIRCHPRWDFCAHRRLGPDLLTRIGAIRLPTDTRPGVPGPRDTQPLRVADRAIRTEWTGTTVATNPRYSNGHRRRELRARVLATEDMCALCDQPVDKGIPQPDPRAPVLDEDIPVSRGGSPYQRANVHLMHRSCNRWKSTMTLAEARAARVEKQGVEVISSTVW